MVLLKNQKFLITVFCLMLFALAGEAKANIIFDGKFEQGDHWVDRNHWSGIGWPTSYISCIVNANGLRSIPAPISSGFSGYVGLFTVNPGDTCNSAIGDERSMVGTQRINAPDGSEQWFSFSEYISPDFKISGKTWYVIWQFKDTNDLTIPVRLGIQTSASEGYNVPHWVFGSGTPRSNDNLDYFFPTSMSIYGKNDWIVHVKWSFTSSGLVELYKNNVLVYSRYNIRTLADNPIIYGTIGIYRNPRPTTNQIYMTGMKIGTTRADVEYSGTSTPLPAHCSNSVKDADETGINCGGSCPACVTSSPSSASLTISGTPSSSQPYSIELTTSSPEDIKVDFLLDNAQYRTETNSPYCFFLAATGDGSVCYKDRLLQDGPHTVTAKIYSQASGALLDTKSITFTQGTASQASTTSLTLKPGWNQISSSIVAGIDIATIESSCTILQYKNQKLWSWNAQAQSWINPAKVEPFKGYWIYAAYTCTVPISGTPATFSSLQLYNGWNKVSAQGSLSAIAGTCANHIVGNWIWNWDKATEKWIHPAEMQSDKGYWIKVDQDCVLSV